MEELEKQYRRVNDRYNEFSYALIAYNKNSNNKPMLKKCTKALARSLEAFWKKLNEIGGTEE